MYAIPYRCHKNKTSLAKCVVVSPLCCHAFSLLLYFLSVVVLPLYQCFASAIIALCSPFISSLTSFLVGYHPFLLAIILFCQLSSFSCPLCCLFPYSLSSFSLPPYCLVHLLLSFLLSVVLSFFHCHPFWSSLSSLFVIFVVILLPLYISCSSSLFFFLDTCKSNKN